MSGAAIQMTSNRPYLIRAMYEWIGDNGLTPYLLVDADSPGVQVPTSAVRDGKVVLNVAARAVSQLELGNQSIHFLARFGGVSQLVEFPVTAVQAIYAQETGQGMMMPPESADGEGVEPPPESDPPAPQEPAARRGAHLRVVK
ncbi:MAG: ClpXP protease specificity-enhancing factor [Lysobacteraceae bacterium]|uniref:ClpXP protease specificity-enhancing factor n=1 Tax=Denitratimonas sp. CY0512 TaxID=3131940 RepID=UPI0030B058D7